MGFPPFNPNWLSVEANAMLVRAAHFFGVGDIEGQTAIHRDSAFTGVVDSPTGIISAWWNNENNADGASYLRTASNVSVDLQVSNTINAILSDGGSSNLLNFGTDAGVIDSNWHNIISSWDTNHAAGSRVVQFVFDGVIYPPIINDDLGVAFNIPWISGAPYTYPTLGPWDSPTSTPLDLAEFYLNTAEYIDLSIPTNVAKFRNPITGKPADIGSNGSIPTGTAPAVYLSMPSTGPASQFIVNNGTGGDFALFGTLVRASSDPF